MNTQVVHPRNINVRVLTTSGTYPEHGHEAVPVDEVVSAVLHRTAKFLSLADISNWVAKVRGEEIDVTKTYVQLGLHGEVKIDFGPREGGGGNDESGAR